MRTCVIVSPYFPPSTLAGVHRGRHLAKHLPAAGWKPIVVCVNELYHQQRLDPSLATLVPSTVEIVKVSALPARVCRPFGLGEISLRAWRSLQSALFRILQSSPVEVVLITGSPFYPMLLAGEIKRRYGVPTVLDFQDPWVSVTGSDRSPWTKAGMSNRLARLLEPRAIRSASFVTSVSEVQNLEMIARYPHFDPARMAAIPIGGDPEDFDALRECPPTRRSTDLTNGRVNLSYIGTIWPRVIPTLWALMRALALLRVQKPQLYSRMRLNFVGTSALPNQTAPQQVRPIAEAAGVSDVVHEVPSRVPYLEALSTQANSDGLLLLGSDEPHYTASKIYSTLMSGRPFLSILHERSSAYCILERAGGGINVGFSETAELHLLHSKIAEGLTQLMTSSNALGRRDPSAYAPFEARAIAQSFGAVFDQVSSR